MAVRFYLMPMNIRVTPGGSRIRSPKYAIPGPYDGHDMGFRDVYFFAADLTAGQHTTLAGNADVVAVPANLDNTTGANRTTVVAALRQYRFPGSWITTATTYRQICRVLLGTCMISQQYEQLAIADGADRDIAPAGITLDTQYNDMPVDYRQRLVQAIDNLPYDRSSLTGTSTLEDLFTLIGQQVAPFTMLGVAV